MVHQNRYIHLMSLNYSDSTCDDIHHCRTIWNIIWSCLATVMGCTWAAMHPNISSSKEPQLVVALRRAGIVGFTLIAPEMTILWAMRQWVVARKLATEYRGTNPVVQQSFLMDLSGFLRLWLDANTRFFRSHGRFHSF
jgi:hypothetical protein